MKDLFPLSIWRITGKLPIDEGRKCSNWSLKILLDSRGYKVKSIFIRDDFKTYFGEAIKYLVADVYVNLTPEQKEKYHTTKDVGYCAIKARYLGSNSEWGKCFYEYVDDIEIRYSEYRNFPRTITFTKFCINNKFYALTGDSLCWDVMDYYERLSKKNPRE